MHMIRHDHITHQQEFVALVNCTQGAHKQVSRTNGTQQRQSSVTTERHKMQVAAAIIAFQIPRHERPTQEPTCNPDTWGTQHPKIVVSYLSSIRSTSVILLACLQQDGSPHRLGHPPL